MKKLLIMKPIKCLRCKNKAFSISVGLTKPVGYCKECAEKILVAVMIMDVQNKYAKKTKRK